MACTPAHSRLVVLLSQRRCRYVDGSSPAAHAGAQSQLAAGTGFDRVALARVALEWHGEGRRPARFSAVRLAGLVAAEAARRRALHSSRAFADAGAGGALA